MKDKVYRQKQQIEGEFYKLHAFLDEEEKRLLKRLKNEERETLKQLHRNLEQLSKQNNSLGELVAEVKKKSWQPNVVLLKGMQKTLKRCENVALVKIEPVPTELSLVYNIPSTDIMEILSHFKVGLSLDPATAHSSLVVSKDRKSVQYRGAQQQGPPEEDKAERFDTYLLVLSSERFTWGRRYWEVEVGDSKEWDLGVCRESVGRKGQAPIMSPLTGFWRLWLRNGSQLKALNFYPTPLPMKLKPTRVGVFLDYLGGEVSFYNVTEKTLIYKYVGTFYTPLRAFFSPSRHPEDACPLSVCPVQRGDTTRSVTEPAFLGGSTCEDSSIH